MMHSFPRWLAVLALFAPTACRVTEPTAPPSVILIGIDTLRADRLGPYGACRRSSPLIDEQARRGMVFTRAYSTSPWTLPSFASIFTGRLPLSRM